MKTEVIIQNLSQNDYDHKELIVVKCLFEKEVNSFSQLKEAIEKNREVLEENTYSFNSEYDCTGCYFTMNMKEVDRYVDEYSVVFLTYHTRY